MRSDLSSVTVLMAVLNGEPYLAEALDGLAAQTHPAHEILVLDGGSTDGSRERAEAAEGVTLVDLPGAGWHVALNAGMARATGEIVAFTSCDDVMEPAALEEHVAALRAAPDAGYSVGCVRFFSDEGGHSASVPNDLDGTVRWARIIEAVAIRRRVLGLVGGFRVDVEQSADVEWIARLGDLGVSSVSLASTVVAKRLHTRNTSYSTEGVDAGITQSLRLSILRKQGRA